jgi:hypothetical protein
MVGRRKRQGAALKAFLPSAHKENLKMKGRITLIALLVSLLVWMPGLDSQNLAFGTPAKQTPYRIVPPPPPMIINTANASFVKLYNEGGNELPQDQVTAADNLTAVQLSLNEDGINSAIDYNMGLATKAWETSGYTPTPTLVAQMVSELATAGITETAQQVTAQMAMTPAQAVTAINAYNSYGGASGSEAALASNLKTGDPFSICAILGLAVSISNAIAGIAALAGQLEITLLAILLSFLYSLLQFYYDCFSWNVSPGNGETLAFVIRRREAIA